MGLFTNSREQDRYTQTRDLGVLIVRLTTGGLLAGHGAQKVFGAFGGYGLEGTAGWLESLDLKPGKQWALAAGASELGGGLLTALGLFHPVGPISSLGAMTVAIRKAHWGKPIWVTEGGAELPLTNISIAIALSLVGAGRYSLDELFGVRVPNSFAVMTAAAVALGAVASEAAKSPSEQDKQTAEEMAVEGNASHA